MNSTGQHSVISQNHISNIKPNVLVTLVITVGLVLLNVPNCGAHNDFSLVTIESFHISASPEGRISEEGFLSKRLFAGRGSRPKFKKA